MKKNKLIQRYGGDMIASKGGSDTTSKQVIEHYAKDVLMNGKVINLEEYKKAMSLE